LALKGHGFSRAIKAAEKYSALAAEGMHIVENELIHRLKPGRLWEWQRTRMEQCLSNQ